MTTPLKEWPRPHWKPGGGDAFLYYAIFGEADYLATISRSKYRTNGIPPGIEMMSYGRSGHPEVVSLLREDPMWSVMTADDPELGERASRETECVVVKGAVPDPANLDYFRDVVGLVMHSLDHGGVAVHDPQMVKLWSSGEWRKKVFDVDWAAPRQHVVILYTPEENGTEWFHTRGMRKFGRPDVSIHDVPPHHRAAIIDLLQRLIERQALGLMISEAYRIRRPSLPDGMTCHHKGDVDNPEFNNVHIEIAWPSA